jgi:hypothetical protein
MSSTRLPGKCIFTCSGAPANLCRVKPDGTVYVRVPQLSRQMHLLIPGSLVIRVLMIKWLSMGSKAASAPSPQ